uniref:PSF2p n=1 Tax=Chlamydomonas reinhardtii TaxID=3055 RepID=D5LAU9_CHLRE|nr:PSF2p [Chlamydomonas reinhardtii]
MSQALAVVPVGAQEHPAATSADGAALERHQPKAIKSRVLDHVGPYLRLMQARLASPHVSHATALQPVFASSLELLPPCAYPELPASSVGTKFVTTSFFRHRAAINHLLYTPDGRRLLCGGNNGNVSLWNGTNFENELGPGIQAHEASPIRCMEFSHSGLFLLSCDDAGRVKFSRPTLEVLQVYQAHKEPCRAVTFSPTDYKFATGSDDSTVRVFDTFRGQECAMTGHGGDVRWVDWHPTKGVIASCSKDACVKLWDPRAAAAGCLSTLHGHKNGVFQARVKWNRNGHWLLSCSRDQLVKLYDVRMLKEVASFAGHGRDVACVAWHPQHEELFVSGAGDGSLMMWLASRPDAQGCLPAAHEAAVWSAAWHPLGHVLASAGGDNKCQFWCRKRPGDIFADVFDAGSAAAAPGGTPAAVAAAAAAGAAGGLGDGGGVAGGGGGGMFGLGAGAGLLGPGAGGAAGAAPGLFGGPLQGGPAGTPAYGVGAAGGTGAAAARPNVIPGIGAALEGLTTANLQVRLRL